MNEQKQNVANQELLARQKVGSGITEVYDLIRRHPELVHFLLKSEGMQLSEKDRLRKAVEEMHIGRRIHDELKRKAARRRGSPSGLNWNAQAFTTLSGKIPSTWSF